MEPIWKDYQYTLPLNDDGYVDFRIYDITGGVLIYTGKAYPRPGDSVVYLRINDICADYLTRTFPPEGTDYYSRTFRLQYNIGDGWVTYNLSFTRDWSYDADFDPDDDTPSVPIRSVLHSQQYVPIFGSYGDGFPISLRTSIGDFSSDDYNEDFFSDGDWTDVENTGLGHFIFFPLMNHSGILQVSVNGRTYDVDDECGNIVLYYLNAYGGWDSLLVQGRTVRTDSYSRHTRDVVYSNRTYPARGTHEYVNEITQKWKLNIGPLTDTQSARMHHLVGSTFVYLHDLETNRIHPVIVEEESLEHKIQPGSLHMYSVTVSLAQERIRR